MSSACDLVTEMLLILKNISFDLIIQGQVLDMTVQRNVSKETILYGINLWMKPSATLGLFSSPKCRDRLWLLAKFRMRHRLIYRPTWVAAELA